VAPAAPHRYTGAPMARLNEWITRAATATTTTEVIEDN
jgi:hypothetical protein